MEIRKIIAWCVAVIIVAGAAYGIKVWHDERLYESWGLSSQVSSQPNSVVVSDDEQRDPRYRAVADLMGRIDPGTFTFATVTKIGFLGKGSEEEPYLQARYTGTTTVTGELMADDLLGMWCLIVDASEAKKFPHVTVTSSESDGGDGSVPVCFTNSTDDLKTYPNPLDPPPRYTNVTATVSDFVLIHNIGSEGANTARLIAITPYTKYAQ